MSPRRTPTTVVNLKRGEPYDVYIGRAGRGETDGTFGKPREFGGFAYEWMAQFRSYFLKRLAVDGVFRARVLALKGKRLGCFCKPKPCHGDVIVEWLEEQGATWEQWKKMQGKGGK